MSTPEEKLDEMRDNRIAKLEDFVKTQNEITTRLSENYTAQSNGMNRIEEKLDNLTDIVNEMNINFTKSHALVESHEKKIAQLEVDFKSLVKKEELNKLENQITTYIGKQELTDNGQSERIRTLEENEIKRSSLIFSIVTISSIIASVITVLVTILSGVESIKSLFGK